MLGGDDDLAAVLSVLDRLSNELVSNRAKLDLACDAADSLGGGAPLPLPATDAGDTEIAQDIERERQDCIFLQSSLGQAVDAVVKSKALLLDLLQTHSSHELDFGRRAAQDLLAWQERVGTANDEYYQLRSQSLEIDAKLSKLYRRLQESTVTW